VPRIFPAQTRQLVSVVQIQINVPVRQGIVHAPIAPSPTSRKPATTKQPATAAVITQIVYVNLDIVPATPAPRPILRQFQAVARLLASVEATTRAVSASKENVLARAVANKRISLSHSI
jgi:hypothetical protein